MLPIIYMPPETADDARHVVPDGAVGQDEIFDGSLVLDSLNHLPLCLEVHDLSPLGELKIVMGGFGHRP